MFCPLGLNEWRKPVQHDKIYIHFSLKWELTWYCLASPLLTSACEHASETGECCFNATERLLLLFSKLGPPSCHQAELHCLYCKTYSASSRLYCKTDSASSRLHEQSLVVDCFWIGANCKLRPPTHWRRAKCLGFKLIFKRIDNLALSQKDFCRN